MELEKLISYKLLKETDETLFAQVKAVYDMVKETINGISGCFNEYTMHNMDHSLRVANYMEQLAFGIDETKIETQARQFNAAEYAILLLSSILHDIGMFIRPQDRSAIKNGVVKYSETLTFQGVLNVKNGDENEAIKEIVRLTHAARINEFLNYKFNDKTSTIADLLKIDNKYSYAEDVALVCQAHGEDYDFIKNKLRNSTTKGQYEYNQQYFAALLRIADYLDLDKQRTPILWFSMMGIDGFSKSEWETHFQISNEKKLKSYFDGKLQIYFDGKSSNAKIHRKYLKYIDDLTKEVEMADDFLNHKDAPEKYRLRICRKIDNLVQTEGFDYSDLRLSLDYSAITELLMGKNIYGDSKLGLRELIQNSIDACKLMKEISSEYSTGEPAIRIIISKKDGYVKIWDTGIGMTLDVVKNHFLSVGKSYYKTNEYLFKNFNYKPIGQYGIGFLACFLLSDNIVVKTKHYKSNQVYQIELEKNSEYVVTHTEESPLFCGTEIKLEYKSFFDVFKSTENLLEFLKTSFETTVPIYFCDKDSASEELITNRNHELLKQIVERTKKGKIETIDCSMFSSLLTGRILMKPQKVLHKQGVEDLLTNEVYIFKKKQNKFEKTVEVPEGLYRLILYAKLREEDYNEIKKTSKAIEKKQNEILALAKKTGTLIMLLVNQKDKMPLPAFIFDQDDFNESNTLELFKNSKLEYYEELFYYKNFRDIYVYENKYMNMRPCRLFNETRFRSMYSEGETYPTCLYYKDILVKDFRVISAIVPYNFSVCGYINYAGTDLRLDVSRNEIIEGEKLLDKEFNKTILKYKRDKESDPQIRLFIDRLLDYLA